MIESFSSVAESPEVKQNIEVNAFGNEMLSHSGKTIDEISDMTSDQGVSFTIGYDEIKCDVVIEGGRRGDNIYTPTMFFFVKDVNNPYVISDNSTGVLIYDKNQKKRKIPEGLKKNDPELVFIEKTIVALSQSRLVYIDDVKNVEQNNKYRWIEKTKPN